MNLHGVVLVLGVPVLERVVGEDGSQVVRVPADNLRASLRIVTPLSVTLHVKDSKRLCIGQCRHFQRLY